MRGGFIASTFERLLKLDMRKWLRFVADMDLMPTILGTDVRYIYLQPSEGDVTIVPAISLLRDSWYLVENPSRARLQSYIQRGAQATFPSLSQINCYYQFEQTLNACLAQLQAEADREAEQERRVVAENERRWAKIADREGGVEGGK
jgi:hypothetical protein